MKSKSAKSRISASVAAGPVDDLVRAIKDDHQDLKKFISVMKDEDASLPEKREAAELFMSLLKSHAPSEEKTMYARCLRADEELRIMAEEGYVEHHITATLMKGIAGEKARDKWLAKVKVLAELVEHHIKEEESEFLPAVEKHFADKKQMTMAHEFYALRKQSQRGRSAANSGVLRAI